LTAKAAGERPFIRIRVHHLRRTWQILATSKRVGDFEESESILLPCFTQKLHFAEREETKGILRDERKGEKASFIKNFPQRMPKRYTYVQMVLRLSLDFALATTKTFEYHSVSA